MRDVQGEGQIAESPAATAWRCGGVIEVRPRRALPAIEAASAAELSDIWGLVGRVQREYMPEGARVEFVSGGGEPLVIQIGAVAQPTGLLAQRGFVPGQETHFVEVLRAGLRIAQKIDMVAAFVMASGIAEIAADLEESLRRGAQIRVLTGDTLEITDPEGLATLLAWMSEFERFEAKLYRCPERQTFHAKAYIFVGADDRGVAYVGSSNLSKSALLGGIEWNLRAVEEQAEFAEIGARFERLWEDKRAAELTPELLAEYRARRTETRAPIPAEDRPPPPPTPHAIQAEALQALADARARGERRGLVVLATGLGKTLLSAFDFAATKWRRALFVAHRAEILDQACAQWGRALPDRSRGLWVGGKRERGADMVFASIQALTQPGTLESIDPRDFDYVVIDEFHHAAASTYARLIKHLQPRYLLGLTATPERSDGAELLRLCDDNLVYRAGLRKGLGAALLVPFHYFAVMDSVDYEPIPWRSGRFDEVALTSALATREQAAAALAALDARTTRSSRRVLIFCCSIAHAEFMAEFLREQEIAAVAMHSRPTTMPRAEALRRFKAGELEALTAVDLFNEGLDIPDIDAVLMLRPTESPVVFLQQIGRGLRLGRGRPKSHLTVVDMVGNHQAYLHRLDALRCLLEDDRSRSEVLRALRAGSLVLPANCTVDLPTEFVDVLEQLLVREREAESRAAVLALNPPIRLKLLNNKRNPILVLDRERRPDTPEGETEVEADGETYILKFAKIAVNVAKRPGSEGNVLPDLLRAWFGPDAGWGKDYVALSFRRGRWQLDPVRASAAPIRHGVRYFPELAVACGFGPIVHGELDARVVAVRTELAVDAKRHFVVRAEGDSMAGGEAPIHDGDLVLCEWARDASLAEVAGRACVLVIHDGPEHTEVVLKIPVREGDQWVLRSQASGTRDRIIPAGAEVRVIARAMGPVLLG